MAQVSYTICWLMSNLICVDSDSNSCSDREISNFSELAQMTYTLLIQIWKWIPLMNENFYSKWWFITKLLPSYALAFASMWLLSLLIPLYQAWRSMWVLLSRSIWGLPLGLYISCSLIFLWFKLKLQDDFYKEGRETTLKALKEDIKSWVIRSGWIPL